MASKRIETLRKERVVLHHLKTGVVTVPFRHSLDPRRRAEVEPTLLIPRCDRRRREAAGEPIMAYDSELFRAQLLEVAAGVMAVSEDATLVFVGRSAHPIFDILSAAYSTTMPKLLERLQLFHYSLRFKEDSEIPKESLMVIREYMTDIGLHPTTIIRAKRPVALVDIVCSAHSMRNLIWLLYRWTKEIKEDWTALLGHLRVISIREDNIPFNWFDWLEPSSGHGWPLQGNDVEFGPCVPHKNMRSVLTGKKFWRILADGIPKTCESYPWVYWSQDEDLSSPAAELDSKRYEGLMFALSVYDHASSKEGRFQLAAAMARLGDAALKQSWYRSRMVCLKGRQPSKLHDNVHNLNLKSRKSRKSRKKTALTVIAVAGGTLDALIEAKEQARKSARKLRADGKKVGTKSLRHQKETHDETQTEDERLLMVDGGRYALPQPKRVARKQNRRLLKALARERPE